MGLGRSKPERRCIKLVAAAAKPGAGLTTTLQALGLGEYYKSSPTYGFDLEHVEGSDEAGRPVLVSAWKFPYSYSNFNACGLYHFWYEEADGLIFVVDARDATANDACTKLTRMMSEADVQGKPLLVYANFRDQLACQPDAQPQRQSEATSTVEAITEALKLDELSARHGSAVHVQPVCAISDAEASGIMAGYEWMMMEVARGGNAETRQADTPNAH